MVGIVLTVQTGPPADPGAAQSTCFVKRACFCNEQWYHTRACVQVAQLPQFFALPKFWMLDFYNRNDLLVYVGNYKHEVILPYYPSLIYSNCFSLRHLQQPSYHAATHASARRGPPSRAQSPDPGSISIVCSLCTGGRSPVPGTATDCPGEGEAPVGPALWGQLTGSER